ncbi:MAG: hypothetical protein DWB43_02985 [Lautropia sp.]|nr:MAG: hypothetical protein EDM78_06230 [Pseudomonadota bacterium]MBC6958491.1 hypothetical protein [Lautropia sp.]RIK90798.1 MAG: hypothetical protein DCC70_03475 [Burkholderiales bacterium]
MAGNGAARTGNSRWRRVTEQRAGSAKSVFHFDGQGPVAKSTPAGERLGLVEHLALLRPEGMRSTRGAAPRPPTGRSGRRQRGRSRAEWPARWRRRAFRGP